MIGATGFKNTSPHPNECVSSQGTLDGISCITVSYITELHIQNYSNNEPQWILYHLLALSSLFKIFKHFVSFQNPLLLSHNQWTKTSNLPLTGTHTRCAHQEAVVARAVLRVALARGGGILGAAERSAQGHAQEASGETRRGREDATRRRSVVSDGTARVATYGFLLKKAYGRRIR